MRLPLLCFATLLPSFFAPCEQQLPILTSPYDTVLISNETNTYIRHLLSTWNSSGIAVGVVRRDPTVPSGWRHEFASHGPAQADGSLVTPDTQFAIASNTKLFTAISVGLLISNQTLAKERGQTIDWRTKISDLIPEWKLQDQEMSTGTNLQDMLSHRTGMPRHDYILKPYYEGVSSMIASLRYLRPSAEFRETFQYNNLMYETLSYLPQILLNQTFESYVEQHIFAPLNMTSTTFSVAKAEAGGNLAHGFFWNRRDLVNGVRGSLSPAVPYFQRPGEEHVWAGAGGILTSARDLATWMSMLLNNGRHPITNDIVVPQAILDYASTGVTIMRGSTAYPELSPKVYGAGQMRYSYQGHELIEHSGHNPGYMSLISRLPSDNLGIIALSNDDAGIRLIEAVRYRLVEDILDLKRIDWDARIKAEFLDFLHEMQDVTPRSSSPTPPSSPFEHLDGASFTHPGYGSVIPCLVPKTPSEPVSSRLCDDVLQSVPVKQILNDSDLSIPTFIASFKGLFTTYIRLQHFSSDLFNVSIVYTNAEVRSREHVKVGENIVQGLDSNVLVEWVNDENGGGLAFKGNFYGKEEFVPKLSEKEGKASAEVWFARDHI